MFTKNFIHYSFKDPSLLEVALTHKSFCNENDSKNENNERLEFLGDAVLSLGLSLFIMKKFPHFNEGQLSKARSSLVNEDILSRIAFNLGVPQSLKLGRGETRSGGEKKPRLLASALEAIIGAICLDSGFKSAEKVIEEIFSFYVEKINEKELDDEDYKTQLQEQVQRSAKETPKYRVISEEGFDHAKTFKAEVYVKEKVLGKGLGRSKKQAEQSAAQVALGGLSELQI